MDLRFGSVQSSYLTAVPETVARHVSDAVLSILSYYILGLTPFNLPRILSFPHHVFYHYSLSSDRSIYYSSSYIYHL